MDIFNETQILTNTLDIQKQLNSTCSRYFAMFSNVLRCFTKQEAQVLAKQECWVGLFVDFNSDSLREEGRGGFDGG